MAEKGRFRVLRAHLPKRKEEGLAEVLRKRQQERTATEKTYTATVRVTFRAQDEREAKQILDGVRGFGADVETIEGPDLGREGWRGRGLIATRITKGSGSPDPDQLAGGEF